MINLDAEMSIKKAMLALIFEIDGNSIYIAMALMNQDITMLFQIIMLISEIR